MPVPVGLIAERQIVARLLRASAVSVDTATRLDDLRWVQAHRLNRLIAGDVVRRTASDGYYINPPALADHITRRRRRVAVVVLVLAVVAAFWLRVV
ncbi:MAG: hypothetical protein ABI051_10265 [Vicinamibacterales bacterium]